MCATTMKTVYIVTPIVLLLVIAIIITAVLLLRKRASNTSVLVANSAGNTSSTTSTSNTTPTTVIVTTSAGGANNVTTVAVPTSSQAPPAVYVAALALMKNNNAANAQSFRAAYQEDPAMLAILSRAMLRVPSDAGSGTSESLVLSYITPDLQTLYGPIYAPVILLAFKSFSSAVNASAPSAVPVMVPPGAISNVAVSITSNVSTPALSTIAIVH